jgi:class 3 adenylate cyclase
MAGKLKLEELITRRYSIDEAPQAFADLQAGKNARGVIVFSEMAERILVVDDQRTNAEMVAGLLRNLGYEIDIAHDGAEALRLVEAKAPDLVLSDILMPGIDGYELCRRLRASAATALLPVILVTASAEAQTERIKGVEAGADDFLAKPVNWPELFGRVRRLLQVKALQDEIKNLNAELEHRVRDQVAQLERLSRMKRFFSRAVAEAIVAGGEELLEPHRREITAVFLDLRGFTAFTDRADPDEVMDLLREYHATLGRTVDEFGGTLEHFAGDGVMIFFNDPIEVENPAERAIRMALALQRAFNPIAEAWAKLGHDVGLGVGIAQGDTTLGVIGFEQRWEYAAIGNVPNLAARLCGSAHAGEIILDLQTEQDIVHIAETEFVGALSLRGFQQPVPAFRLKRMRE